MPDEPTVADESSLKGVKTRIFGVMLICIGLLDSLLSWRGAAEVGEFPLGLLAAGLFLFVVGARPRRSLPTS